MNYNNLACHPGPISPPDRHASSFSMLLHSQHQHAITHPETTDLLAPAQPPSSLYPSSPKGETAGGKMRNETKQKRSFLWVIRFEWDAQEFRSSMETSVRRSWTFLRLCLRKNVPEAGVRTWDLFWGYVYFLALQQHREPLSYCTSYFILLNQFSIYSHCSVLWPLPWNYKILL